MGSWFEINTNTMGDNQTEARKLASSLILVTPGENPSSGQHEVNYLVTQRSANHPVLPLSICFPGGTAAAGDSSVMWKDLYKSHGIDIEKIELMKTSAHLPLIYLDQGRQEYEARSSNSMAKNAGSSSSKNSSVISKQISLRISAIRETFEECGILLCFFPTKDTLVNYKIGEQSQIRTRDASCISSSVFKSEDEVKEWQVKVRKNPENFLHLCKSFSCLPDLKNLYEWSNWASPPTFAANQFDTIFYMAFAQRPLPTVIDPREVEYAQWTTAARVLQGQELGEYFLPPPQFYEMSRLRDIHSISHLKNLAELRRSLGIERFCPLYYAADHAFISCLPGDELYNENVLMDAPIPYPENVDSTNKFHRVEIQGKKRFKVIVNIPYRFGQSYDNITSSL